ncbi:MAG: LuxR C-terminal-related transcriptional regulator [Nitrospiraceae bacterium]
MQVLRLLGKGQSISAIAAHMSLSVKTVSTYRSRLLEKLELRSTGELVKYAIDHQLSV